MSSPLDQPDRSSFPNLPAFDWRSSGSRQEALERVLEQTLVPQVGNPSTASDRRRLTEVARRYAHQALTLEPMVVELIRAALVDPFAGMFRSDKEWQAATIEIATQLWNDPTARERLVKLWQRLTVE